MKILVIDDEAHIGRILKKGLTQACCVVDVARSGKEGVSFIQLNEYDVVILDFYLRDARGDSVARTIRTIKPTIPIIVLSAEQATTIKVSMLGMCDDYLTKPFSLAELTARLHALRRRGPTIQEEILTAGPLVLDAHRFTVELDGVPLPFRNREFALLEYLMRHQDIVLSRETILAHVWDMYADPFTNTVDTHIRLLRKKIESPDRMFIHTVPKRGYRFSFEHIRV